MRVLAPILLVLCSFLHAETYYSDPEKGKNEYDGSAKAPWGSLEDVVKAGQLKKLKGGDTLLLRSGDHGDVHIRGDNDEFIVIAAEKGQTPRLARFVIESGKKWRVSGLTVSSSFAKKPYKGWMVELAEAGAGSEIVFENSYVYSVLDTTKWSAKDWMSCSSGILLGRRGTNLTLRNNYVLNTRFGVAADSPNSMVEGNVITDYSADGVRVTRDGITAQYNVIKNCYVSAKDGDDNHDDGIQVFLFNKGTGTVRDLTIKGNMIVSHEDPKQPFMHPMQGLGFFDGPLVNFLVEGNVICSETWHGVALYDAQGCKILNNACWCPPNPDIKCRPWVMLGTKQKQVKPNTVKDNLACSFNFKADSGVTAENNKIATEETFKKKQDELRKTIDEKYGKYHPVAKFARLGKDTAESEKTAALPVTTEHASPK